MSDRPQYFSALRPAQVPDVSKLTGVDAYVQAYHKKYAEVARALIETTQLIKKVSEASGVKVKDIGTLAALAFNFVPNDGVKETKQYVVSPDQRFHPSEMEGEAIYERDFKLSFSQTLRLVEDLKRAESHLKTVAHTSSENPGVVLRHIVSANNFDPIENFAILLQEGGNVYNNVGLDGNVLIGPERVDFEGFDTYRLNRMLGLFDQTESGTQIPLGYNRLALLYAAQKFLAEEVKRQQAKNEGVIDRLKELGKGLEETK